MNLSGYPSAKPDIMGIKQILLNKFIRWPESKGLIYIRTSASHDYYNYPERDPRRLSRNIVVRTKDKDIPQFHLHSNLQTLGISKSRLEEEIKSF